MLAPVRRPTFDEMNLSTGKRVRLHRMMYEHGPANGTLMFLPIDQGLEHGPVDFFSNPESIDTDWIYRLGGRGEFLGHRAAYRSWLKNTIRLSPEKSRSF